MVTRPTRAKPAASTPPAAPIAARGEYSISLEGVDYTLTPSFAAIGGIETATGKTIFELAVAAGEQRLSLAEASEITAECMRANARARGDTALAAMRTGRVSELLYAEPGGLLLAVRAIIAPLLIEAVTGGFTALGNRKP